MDQRDKLKEFVRESIDELLKNMSAGQDSGETEAVEKWGRPERSRLVPASGGRDGVSSAADGGTGKRPVPSGEASASSAELG
jgi:hypothetical protein